MDTRKARFGRSSIWLVAVTLLLGCGSEPTSPPPDNGSPILRGLRLEPLVVTPGESFHLELDVDRASGAVLDVQFLSSFGSPLLVDGVPFDDTLPRTFSVYDDGTHGDAHAGDDVFTTDALTVPPGPMGMGSAQELSVRFRDAPSPHEQGVVLSLRSVDPARVAAPATVDLAPDVRASARVVSLIRDDPQVFGNEDELARIVRRFYEIFPDDRNILLVARPSRMGTGTVGLAYEIRPWASGIGSTTTRPAFGSGGSLHIVVEAGGNMWLPQPPVEGSFCLVIHELTHQWAAHTGPPLSGSTGHWNFDALARDSSGFGRGGVCQFNDLELYLAGWLPPDSVTAPLTATGYTMTNLLSIFGPRFPAEGVRDLKAGLIVVSDRFLTPMEFAYFDRVAQEVARPTSLLGHTWTEATGGRSTLDVILPPPLTGS